MKATFRTPRGGVGVGCCEINNVASVIADLGFEKSLDTDQNTAQEERREGKKEERGDRGERGWKWMRGRDTRGRG